MPATATGNAPAEPYRRLWAELTNKCQLPIDRNNERHADIEVALAGS
jgi:hypothetical protein